MVTHDALSPGELLWQASVSERLQGVARSLRLPIQR
jgi:hypothetical protein